MNGKDYSPHLRGYNVVVVDGATGKRRHCLEFASIPFPLVCPRPQLVGAIHRAPGEQGKNEGSLGTEDPPRSRSLAFTRLLFTLAAVFVRYDQLRT